MNVMTTIEAAHQTPNCVNILGSFECQCQRGYEMMEGECRGK